MKYLFNASGANQPAICEFDILGETAVREGEVVCLTGGVIKGNVKDGVLIGVSAEEHTGTADILNARADGSRLRVNVSPDAVYAVKAMKLSATAGTATTFVCSAAGLTASAAGKLVLVAKSSTSANTDRIGTQRKISSCTVSGTTATFTIQNGAAPNTGDTYAFIPTIGTAMCLDGDKDGAVMANADTDVKLRVVGADAEKCEVFVKLTGGLFA